jgi:Tol biopolymer transport system component
LTAGPLSYKLPLPAGNDDRIFVIGTHTRNQLLLLDSASGRSKSWVADLNARRIGLSPDLQFMAWTSANDGFLWRSRLDGSQRLQLTSPPIQALRLSWSPDGRFLAFDGGEPGRLSKIYLVPASGGTPEMLLREERNETDPSWSADGKSIVFGRLPEYLGEDAEDKAIYTVDVATRNMTMLPGSSGLFSPRWSPDGRYIAAMSLNQRKLLFFDELSSGWSSVDVPMVARSPMWSRDSRFLYFRAGKDANVYRVSIVGPGQRRPERVGGTDSLQPADSFSLVGLSTDDSPLVLTKSSTADIYVFSWLNR